MRCKPFIATFSTVLCTTLTLAQPVSVAMPSTSSNPQALRIRITAGTQVLTATLEASPAAADFASMLPLSLTLEDYAATEKIAYLPRKLTTAGAPPGVDPAVADIAYYSPWGNLALFYRDAPYAHGLIRLGRLDGGVSTLQGQGKLTVKIEQLTQ
jgi:hypothetical protein